MKLTFTYLINQTEKDWNDFSLSIHLLHENILRKLKSEFIVLIFTEGPPNFKAQKVLDNLINLGVKIINKKFSLKEYVKRDNKSIFIKEFPSTVFCDKYFSLGYRDMCKFFAEDVFYDENLVNSDYFVRVDTDSFFIDVRENFIKDLDFLNCDYAYIFNTVQYEDKAVALGFGNFLYKYCKKNLAKGFLNKSYYEICNEATLRPMLHYTNFEVVNLNWARSKNYHNFMKDIIETGGIYNYRWGDAIRYYALNFCRLEQKFCMDVFINIQELLIQEIF